MKYERKHDYAMIYLLISKWNSILYTITEIGPQHRYSFQINKHFFLHSLSFFLSFICFDTIIFGSQLIDDNNLNINLSILHVGFLVCVCFFCT